MKTKIFTGNTYANIKPTDPVRSSARLEGFCMANGLPKGVIYKKYNVWLCEGAFGNRSLLGRTLDMFSFQNVYDILTKEQEQYDKAMKRVLDLEDLEEVGSYEHNTILANAGRALLNATYGG